MHWQKIGLSVASSFEVTKGFSMEWEGSCERAAFAIPLPTLFFENVISPKGCLWHDQNTKRSGVL